MGRFGVGKSSLLNLVEFELLATSKASVVTCRVDAWGRTDQSLATQVLRIAIDRLRQETDCTDLLLTPERYQKALEGPAGPWGTFVWALVGFSLDAVEQLKRLDAVLYTLDLTMIIMIEDVDRNLDSDAFRVELPSLLDRMRGLSNIKSVLAVGSDSKYSPIAVRICDIVETLA